MVMVQAQEEEYRRAFQNTVSAMMMKSDLFVLAMIAKAARVVIDESMNVEGTDGRTIYLSPRFLTLSPQEQIYVLAHEAMHVARMDPIRSANYKKTKVSINPSTVNILDIIGDIFNIIADAKINTALQEMGVQVPPNRPMCNRLNEYGIDVSEEDCIKKSVEEILDDLMSRNRMPGVSADFADLLGSGGSGSEGSESESASKSIACKGSGSESGRESGSSKGGGKIIVVNEGDESLTNASGEELRRKILNILMTAVAIKNAGTLPGWAARIVDEIAKPQVDWRKLLMGYLHTGSKVRRVLTRPNRKIDDLPGKQLYGSADVVVLIDTSGSISESELRQFVGEVRGMTPASRRIVVIPFDATAYPEIVIKNKNDIPKLVVNLKGGGGTMIGPALEVVEKKYKKADKVVILSDWEIADLNNPVVDRTLRKMADKVIAVTTHSEPPNYLKKRVRIGSTV